MKILLLSDIHGNWPALQAVLVAEADADQILCLGDLVNYGPFPAECVTWAMKNLSPEWMVQGNHDRAVAFNEDPHCSPAYAVLSEATQRVSERLLTREMKQFLAKLQPQRHFELPGAKCVACHAIPKDLLYGYLPPTAPAPLWESEVVAAKQPDFLFLGHTHTPMKLRLWKTLIVNPGSVGQPKHGDPQAAYAIWDNGEVTLHRTAYDVEETIRGYDVWGLNPDTARLLSDVLRTGGELPTKPVNPKETY
jgi:putative phosphoesterase